MQELIIGYSAVLSSCVYDRGTEHVSCIDAGACPGIIEREAQFFVSQASSEIFRKICCILGHAGSMLISFGPAVIQYSMNGPPLSLGGKF